MVRVAPFLTHGVVPVCKRGCRNIATNYGLVSFTSQLSKVFETIVRHQVLEFLEVNEIIRDSQHGFRKGSSCLTKILLFLWSSYGIGQTIIFSSCRLFFFFSSPNLSHHRLDVCHISTHGVALVQI